MDDIVFENRYELTKQFLRGMAKLSQKRGGKLNLWIFYCATIVLIILCIANIIIRQSILIRTVYALVIFWVTAYPYFIAPARYLRAFSKVGGEKISTYPIIRTIRFDEIILIQTGATALSFSYDRVRYIEETDEFIYFWIEYKNVFFWIENRIEIALPKNSFTIGNPNDFLAFFYEKCSEKKPLWSEKEFNRRNFIDMLPLTIFYCATSAYMIYQLLGRF